MSSVQPRRKSVAVLGGVVVAAVGTRTGSTLAVMQRNQDWRWIVLKVARSKLP